MRAREAGRHVVGDERERVFLLLLLRHVGAQAELGAETRQRRALLLHEHRRVDVRGCRLLVENAREPAADVHRHAFVARDELVAEELAVFRPLLEKL